MNKKIIKTIIILSIIAVIITGYLTYLHYKPVGKSPCNLGGKFDCNAVNKSMYANFFQSIGLEKIYYLLGFDIPVAVMGFFTYLILLLLSSYLYKKVYLNADHNLQKRILQVIFALTLVGFLFSMYLIYIEAFVLGFWCIFCLTQAAIITIMLALAIILLRSKEF